MLQKTNGVVLRSVKYGETSLVVTIFTAVYGIQAYMVQGVRSSKMSRNRSGSFQPGTLLELVVYHNPQKNIQRINQFQAAYIYTTLQEDVIKNSILLFSNELLLRLLPEQAPLPLLFDFVFHHYIALDRMPGNSVANFPLFFIIRCGAVLGFEIKGSFSEQTPYLGQADGEFTALAPHAGGYIDKEDARAMSIILGAADYETLVSLKMNATTRLHLLDWYISFLQLHTEHMGNIKSLAVLRAILH